MKLINKLQDTEFEFKETTHTREIARGVIFNDKKEVAILKVYNESEKFGTRDCYELPGGGVEPGESLEEAFKREMLEETGYEVNDAEEIGDVIDYYNAIGRENHNHYFLGHATTFKGTSLLDYETKVIQKIMFVPIDEAIRLFTYEMFGPVGKLISQREKPVLELAKEMIERKN